MQGGKALQDVWLLLIERFHLQQTSELLSHRFSDRRVV